MIQCSICGEDYWPSGRWRADVCQPCFDSNCAGSQELRVEESVPLTPRQRAALVRIHEVQSRQEDADAL
jgi:hypothetical protein